MFSVMLPFEDFLPVGVCSFEAVGESLLNCRSRLRLPQNAKSVIVYLFPYYLGEKFYENSNISKYCVSEDYHGIAEKYLVMAADELKAAYPQASFQWFCDNSPIPEVKAAVAAGLGAKGDNGLLINDEYGSFCFIGEIVTDLELAPYLGAEKQCLKCGACKKNCPYGALKEMEETGLFQKEKCLSHITQKKGILTAEAEEKIREIGCIWGCDVCQNVCPMNKNIKTTPIPEFGNNAQSRFSAGDSVENRAFSWRGREVIERNLKIICCNDGKNEL